MTDFNKILEKAKEIEKKLLKDKNINEYKNSNEYIGLLNLIPDLELIDIKKND